MKQRDLVRSGLHGSTTKALLGGTPVTGATGAGTVQTDATAITAQFTTFGTVGVNSGAILPLGQVGDEFIVANYGANALKVYPPTGGKVNNGADNAAFSLTAAKTALFKQVTSSGQFVSIMSA